MIYTFKTRPELVRAVGLALGTFLLEALSDPRLATDPRGWAIAAGIGAGHVVVAAILGLYSAPQGLPGQVPIAPPGTPVGAVQPPVGLPGEQGGVWVTPPAPSANFGASDVRVGNTSGLAVQPRPAPVQPQAPAPTAAELKHQQDRERALKGWQTRRAVAQAATPPVVPDKPRARRRG